MALFNDIVFDIDVILRSLDDVINANNSVDNITDGFVNATETPAGSNATGGIYIGGGGGGVKRVEAKSVYLGVFGIFGGVTFVGNIVNVCVFASHRMPRSAFNVLLLGLAVTEGLMGGSFLVYKLLVAYFSESPAVVQLLLSKVGDWMFYSQNWITVVISIFRLMAVAMPLAFKRLGSVNNARWAILVCVAANLLKELPYWYKDFIYDFDPSMKTIEPINQVIGRVIPCVIVGVSTVLSIVKVKHIGSQTIGNRKKRQQEDTSVVRMLLFLLIIFFITNSYCVILILLRIYDVKGLKPLLFSTPIAFGFNSAMNIFLYFCMSPKYRQVFCCHSEEKESTTSRSDQQGAPASRQTDISEIDNEKGVVNVIQSTPTADATIKNMTQVELEQTNASVSVIKLSHGLCTTTKVCGNDVTPAEDSTERSASPVSITSVDENGIYVGRPSRASRKTCSRHDELITNTNKRAVEDQTLNESRKIKTQCFRSVFSSEYKTDNVNFITTRL